MDKIVISAPYKYTVPITTILLWTSLDNIIYKNMINTSFDGSWAINAARQYENETLTGTLNRREANWSSVYKNSLAPYTTQYMKTLSQKPGISLPSAEQSIDICWGETYQLSWLGKFLNGFSANKAVDNYIRTETWATHTSSSSAGTWQVSTGIISALSPTLTYVVVGNISANWGIGDFISANKGFSTFTGRIVSITFTGGSTYIFTDIVNNTPGSGSILGITRVRYYDTLLASSGMIIPCGTWNMKELPEFNDMSCYKYMIYPVKPTTGLFFTPSGGVGPFNQISNGLNYKGTRPRIGLMTTFNIQSCCEITPPLKLAWLNKEGGFDFYKFTLRVDKTLNITRTEFGKKQSKVQSNDIYGYRAGARGRTNWNTKSVENWKVNSDYLTQAELDWLINIYESPEVYIVTEGRRTNNTSPWVEPNLIPVNITNTEVVIHNKAWRNGDTGRLYTYQLEIESAKDRVVQRGGEPARMAYKSLYE
jgi:hypothetical protein